jgi:hypothetical protein
MARPFTLSVLSFCQRGHVLLTLLKLHHYFPWFQYSAAMLMRCALFWGITQHPVVIFYGRFETSYRSHLKVSRDILTLEDETDTLSRNFGKGLPLDAALYPRRAHISSLFWLLQYRISKNPGEVWGLILERIYICYLDYKLLILIRHWI